MTQLSIDDWVARARKAEGEVARQRRHRKWALKELKYRWQQTENYADQICETEADLSRQRRLRKRSIDFARFNYLKRVKSEARVKELEKRVHLLDE